VSVSAASGARQSPSKFAVVAIPPRVVENICAVQRKGGVPAFVAVSPPRTRTNDRAFRRHEPDCRRKPVAEQDDEVVRTLYIVLIVAFTAIVVLFKFQNLETVTVTLLSASLTLPVSSLVLAIYVLGMLTGGFVLALVRGWVRGARRRPD